MKLNADVDPPANPGLAIHITEDNYLVIREYIENQVDHFLINSESWILALFKKMPRTASPGAVRELDEMINKYLSKREIRELKAKLNCDEVNDKPQEPSVPVNQNPRL